MDYFPWTLNDIFSKVKKKYFLKNLTVRVLTDEAEIQRWNELVIEHHYLKNANLIGPQLRYVVELKGWQYLATVMDLFSRHVIGWSVSSRNDTALVCQALRAAVLNRGKLPEGIIHHSDRGSTYTSGQYRKLLHSFAMKTKYECQGQMLW